MRSPNDSCNGDNLSEIYIKSNTNANENDGVFICNNRSEMCDTVSEPIDDKFISDNNFKKNDDSVSFE